MFAHTKRLLALGCFVGSLHAAIVTYTSSAAFAAALGGTPTTTETYEGIALGTVIPGGTTVNGLTYSAFPSGVAGLVNGNFNSFGTRSLTAQRDGSPSFYFGGDSFTITFASSVTASGIFFNANPSVAGSYFMDSTAGIATSSAVYDTSTFFFVGLISTTPYSSITIGSVGSLSSFNVDNLTYGGTAVGVPEPGAAALLAIGLGGLALLRRRRTMAL